MRDYINIINEAFTSSLPIIWTEKNEAEWYGKFKTPNDKEYNIFFSRDLINDWSMDFEHKLASYNYKFYGNDGALFIKKIVDRNSENQIGY